MRSPVQLVALSLLLVGSSTAWDLTPRVLARQTGRRAFSVDQILSLPAPDNLTASPVGSTIAWTFNERGVRNIFVASAPDFTARQHAVRTRRWAGVDALGVFERRDDDGVRPRRRPRIETAPRRAAPST